MTSIQGCATTVGNSLLDVLIESSDLVQVEWSGEVQLLVLVHTYIATFHIEAGVDKRRLRRLGRWERIKLLMAEQETASCASLFATIRTQTSVIIRNRTNR
eukprot:1605575-Amphidinium_carterae.1